MLELRKRRPRNPPIDVIVRVCCRIATRRLSSLCVERFELGNLRSTMVEVRIEVRVERDGGRDEAGDGWTEGRGRDDVVRGGAGGREGGWVDVGGSVGGGRGFADGLTDSLSAEEDLTLDAFSVLDHMNLKEKRAEEDDVQSTD
jgi:hypothetical protein